jgi:long-chain fatty acid transport protein
MMTGTPAHWQSMKNAQRNSLAMNSLIHCLARFGRPTVGALCWLVVSQAAAVGFRNPNQDPEGISRGDAFAATADNPSAIYYNPAGITQIQGLQVRAGLYLISADTKFSGPSGSAETDTSWQPVPQIYCVDTLENLPLSFGLGIYAPYGLSLDWGTRNPFRTAAEKAKLVYLCINPVVAWRILPSLSIAIGPTINYSQATFQQGLTPFNPNDKFKFKGDGVDAGFNAGLLWQPTEQWSFGINYRYATTIDFEGHSETIPSSPFPPYYPRTDTHASLRFPQFIVAGISYRPTKNWNLEVDIDWTDWDNLNRAVFKGTPLGDLPLIFNYTSSFIYDFGVTRQLGKGYFVNLGFIYSENSSPDRNFNPLVPDADLYLPGVGFGYRGKRWDWAVGYHCAINPGRDIKNNVNPTVDGHYKTFNNAVNIAATFKF